ncbi:MAG: hypothetical protein LBK44_01830 [Spirochaetales bacterium]|nr:hypothetical protein [Spirochaetales bacterium]
MQILWAFRFNPLRGRQRVAAQNQARKLPLAISWVHNCPWQLYAATRRSQFCRSKIVWSVTKRSA